MLRLGGIMMGGSGAVQTYRYLLLDVTANNGDGSYMQVRELKWFVGATDNPTSAMTSANAPSPLVVSASSSTGGDDPFMAYDDGAAKWQAGASTGWIKLDLGDGAGITPTSLRLTAKAGGDVNRAPKDFTMEGSNTGSFSGEETVLKTVTGETSWGAGEERTYTF
jgi:hypothetical protein